MHVAKTFIEEKKNVQIKGILSMRMLIFSYTIQQVNVPNFKILGRVVPEKSLTEKKVYTHIHTNIVIEKTKTIHPLSTLYAGVYTWTGTVK